MTQIGCHSGSTSESKAGAAQLTNNVELDHTIDREQKRIKKFETIKDEALNQAELVDSLTEEELEFAR